MIAHRKLLKKKIAYEFPGDVTLYWSLPDYCSFQVAYWRFIVVAPELKSMNKRKNPLDLPVEAPKKRASWPAPGAWARVAYWVQRYEPKLFRESSTFMGWQGSCFPTSENEQAKAKHFNLSYALDAYWFCNLASEKMSKSLVICNHPSLLMNSPVRWYIFLITVIPLTGRVSRKLLHDSRRFRGIYTF